MKRYNICTSRTYTKNGEEKKQWSTVGTLVELDNGGRIVDLFMFPHTTFSVFEQKPKEEAGVQSKALDELPTVEISEDII